MDEVKIVPSWMDEQKITMPLTEFLALKMKIVNLQNEVEKLKDEVSEQRSEKWKAEGERDRLKKDYQKLLGINKENEEGDDGK
jgi:cell division protein FtsL